ncbi:hypothetical protein GP486_005953 [Trichoglossum hirsutum]|uniref:DUF8035 domain-containing protein n=1 Tax=Trichoglossum hirsutum TaxID=265104 RepID=A0A9P8L898_9PEZI|nr:hypothetical protein GP486_005953 [Trichoglossum hirsutum]
MCTSRNQWAEHEAQSHRKVWQCYEHSDAVFRSPEHLTNHLRTHASSLTESQISDLVDVAETSLIDERTVCPICLLDGPFEKGLQNHVANHFERIALFALPRGFSEGEGADSVASQRMGVRSQDSCSSGPLTFSDHGPAPDEGTELDTRVSSVEGVDSIPTAGSHRPEDLADRPKIPGIPKDARWTKINRKLVNPEALDGKERYEATGRHVIVLRVLTPDEIDMYAERTRRIRGIPRHHVTIGKWNLFLTYITEERLERQRLDDRLESGFARRQHLERPERQFERELRDRFDPGRRRLERDRFDFERQRLEHLDLERPDLERPERQFERGRRDRSDFERPERPKRPERQHEPLELGMSPGSRNRKSSTESRIRLPRRSTA